MKKLYFLSFLFIVSALLIWSLMGGEGISPPPPPKPISSDSLVLMVEQIGQADWQNNEQYKKVYSEILLSSSNKNISEASKSRLIESLDKKYVASLAIKYNSLKLNFTAFPSTLYAEMLAFSSKHPDDLNIGISELNAYKQLERMESQVNQYLKGRYNSDKWTSLNTKIDEIKLGDLARNPNCITMKRDYSSTLKQFKSDVSVVTGLIEKCEEDKPLLENTYGYRALKGFGEKSAVIQYPYYKSWFSNPANEACFYKPNL